MELSSDYHIRISYRHGAQLDLYYQNISKMIEDL